VCLTNVNNYCCFDDDDDDEDNDDVFIMLLSLSSSWSSLSLFIVTIIIVNNNEQYSLEYRRNKTEVDFRCRYGRISRTDTVSHGNVFTTLCPKKRGHLLVMII